MADFSLIVIGLFLATYALVGLTERRHVFTMMEPVLPRLLGKSGFHFCPAATGAATRGGGRVGMDARPGSTNVSG
ncbi:MULTISPECIES: hypothetical protein [Halomonadaceae]|uniref:hypothetical protein n=1 Tax=Halomonadaceae TaxID=28256 RepID=UPI001599E895|nr:MULTISPECIES: hypothetical protein [Halomonas]QJQ96297.1 hypothetical protein HIO72_14165 [Halomonas sp. PA5]